MTCQMNKAPLRFTKINILDADFVLFWLSLFSTPYQSQSFM